MFVMSYMQTVGPTALLTWAGCGGGGRGDWWMCREEWRAGGVGLVWGVPVCVGLVCGGRGREARWTTTQVAANAAAAAAQVALA